MSTRFDKKWTNQFLESICGYPPFEQALALALVAQADDNGLIDAIDYDRLVEDAPMSRDGARKMLRHSALAANGVIKRITRIEEETGRILTPAVQLTIP